MSCLASRFFITKYRVLAQSNIHSKYLYCKKWKNYTNKIFLRQISLESNKKERYIPFLEMIKCRRAEAKRSILVQVQSAQSFKELYSYCSSFGEIKLMYHYTVGVVDKSNFIIIEFADETTVNEILLNGSHLQDPQTIPVHSNFLWFKLSGRKLKLKQIPNFNLSAEDGNAVLDDKEFKNILQNCESVSDQIRSLHSVTTLNDVATRLRFLTARQVELCLNGMFPKAVAYPFGSSVNGFGKMGCDLDAVLKLDNETVSKDNRLVFHCKGLNGYERALSQRHMEVIGDLLMLFVPGCIQIRKILQARVPIIKYYQQMTDVECDISMSNMSGVYMSDMLYLFGSLDSRVRPLVFTIRKWAHSVGLTNSSPGRWVTNFSLTLLVLAYLQKPKNSPPILPPLNLLVKSAGPKDKIITEEGVDCTFLRDLNNLNFETKNTDNLEQLFTQFCEYYSNFDFAGKAVCLNEALSITKPDHTPMYIVNPLERGLNVSKNVSLEELEKFKYELRNAAWSLQSQDKNRTNWGILDIFENKKKSLVISSKQSRLMDISRIFSDDDADSANGLNEVQTKHSSVKKLQST